MTLPEKSKPQIDEALKLLQDVLESGGTRFTLKMRRDLEKIETILFSLNHTSKSINNVVK